MLITIVSRKWYKQDGTSPFSLEDIPVVNVSNMKREEKICVGVGPIGNWDFEPDTHVEEKGWAIRVDCKDIQQSIWFTIAFVSKDAKIQACEGSNTVVELVAVKKDLNIYFPFQMLSVDSKKV